MAVLPIRIWGDPVLHAPADEVAEITDEIRALVSDMYETMDAAPGVGLAAPQVGVALRIYVYSFEDDDGRPWRGEILNPELFMTPPEPGHPDEDEESEGCLSFPGERFPLRRSDRVIVTGIDVRGDAVRIDVDGWRARIMQHEFDHLDGIIYLDRVSDRDWKTAQKISKKRGWGKPGRAWTPGIDDLEG
ncbi:MULTISPECIES: peptide deformylase [unclassified Microbacterium]|uniref:peptide deformylase n=1 Tax=unclassified Microbacterium TaxID=2609290 RepID=UPI00097E8726|nr:peptide deformylase [Microbacterium sp. JB110]RCS63011.1 peptide deformylase [Microbacterium sp. JB110]SJM60742.1 Peptide deformylase [Frigoribacterium sp. JB110]